ncbi:hypothetical protein HND97_14050 [Vibrio cholerae]|nr:hypothetical protein HND97_14050 [Vibrio cholerae]
MLLEWMIFTIEPMINAGKFGCRLDDEDSWTVYTADGKKICPVGTYDFGHCNWL